MSNTQALIEEVKNKLRKYSDVGLLDDNSMYREIVLGLKKFGNNVCELHEAVLHVQDGKVDLPENFNNLLFAYLCEPMGYERDSNVEVHDLQSSSFYIERVESNSAWNECTACCENKEEKVIKESLYFNHNKVTFYYKTPTLLRLSPKSLNRSEVNSKCRNRYVRESKDIIDINKRTLTANFKEGYIYINYFGLPIDEDGKINIPDTHNGELEKYLEYRLLSETALDLMGNNDAQGVQSLYNEYRRLEGIALKNAVNDLKMNQLDPDNLRMRMRRLTRLETVKYEAGSWL
jgi:hypothetical protein